MLFGQTLQRSQLQSLPWGGYVYYHYERWQRRKRLEEYLKKEKERGKDTGKRSLLHLMAKVDMTEKELLQASFESKHIERSIRPNKKTNIAQDILLEWCD